MSSGYIWLIVIVAVVVLLVASSLRIVQAYERAVVIRFGRVVGIRNSGLVGIVPFIDRVKKIPTVIRTLGLPAQAVMTKDSVSVTIEAVVYYRVDDVAANYTNLYDSREAIGQLGQSIMRRIVGQHNLDEILTHSTNIVDAIQHELVSGAMGWGINVTQIELKDVALPESMRRAMASKAEAAREAEAKVIAAQGELSASRLLQDAADSLDATGLELRRLQTWREIGTDNSAIIVVTENGTSGAVAAQTSAGQIAANRLG